MQIIAPLAAGNYSMMHEILPHSWVARESSGEPR